MIVSYGTLIWFVLVDGVAESKRFIYFFNFPEQHAAAVIGNKMIVVGGESGNELLNDVQVG